jgi:tetratricopeptide (TPR) repeat protein
LKAADNSDQAAQYFKASESPWMIRVGTPHRVVFTNAMSQAVRLMSSLPSPAIFYVLGLVLGMKFFEYPLLSLIAKINAIQSMKTKIGLLITMFALFVATNALAQVDKPKPPNEKATTAAWDALNANKYEEAITNADQCIEEFRGQAVRLQDKLQSQKVEYPTGAVSDDVKKKIFENGLLNDVAACYFIKGKASEKLTRIEDAKKAYTEAKKLTLARVWDPQGWFWSPAEAAGDRLDALQAH